MDVLVDAGQLCRLTDAAEWIVPALEEAPVPPPGYVVSFVPFHEHGVGAPASDFFCVMLGLYCVELQHLNPNGVLKVSTFVALCKGFVGIRPYVNLHRQFFAASLKMEPIGSCGIHLRAGLGEHYIDTWEPTGNSGWHEKWFYLRNDPARPFPEYSGHVIMDQPES